MLQPYRFYRQRKDNDHVQAYSMLRLPRASGPCPATIASYPSLFISLARRTDSTVATYILEDTSMINQFLNRAITRIALSLTMGLFLATAGAKGPPTDVDVTIPLDDVCSFPVLLELSGKAKTIELPGGRTIYTSPGLHGTVTNLDNPERQETLNITGTFHQEILASGDVRTVVTGRNLLTDPEAGFVLARGKFSFVFDDEGNLVQPLAGKGRLADVCMLIN